VTVDIVKNMGASVRQRLLNHSKASGRPFAEVLQYYAMERFLYRLSMSSHVESFTLKGNLAADRVASSHLPANDGH
jgi:hypothetical protein